MQSVKDGIDKIIRARLKKRGLSEIEIEAKIRDIHALRAGRESRELSEDKRPY